MTALDDALEKYIADENQQALYYDLVLKTDFYVPITDDVSGTAMEERENVTPLILESDGKHYVLLFDTEERVNSWAKKPVAYVILAGYEMAKYTPSDLHWAVNIGNEPAKEFVPDEISWLKSLLEQAPPAEQMRKGN
ncbi:MAG TPA: SseB family protein [Geopsychrobacteraceae bacterium]|nr:SseB family protein [Geopsychrobacteraceae bacterium]